MKEQIIVTKGFNSREFAFTLARNGKSPINQKIMSPFQLAQLAMNRNGLYCVDNIIDDNDAVFIVAKIIHNTKPDYFKNASFIDFVNIAHSLSDLRNLIVDDESEGIDKFVSSAEFKEKNASIKDIYEQYRNCLENNNKKDRIDIIRKVIDEGLKIDSDVISLKEYPLTDLEKKLIETVTGKPLVEKSITEFFDDENKGDVTFKKVYGNSNEIENVLHDIKENDYPLSDCCIAYTDASYCQLIYDYSKVYGIKCNFLNGVQITNTNAAKFICYYDDYMSDNCNIDSFRTWINSECFNKTKLFEKIGLEGREDLFIKAVGNLKLGYNKDTIAQKASEYQNIIKNPSEPDMKEYVEKFAEELSQGIYHMLKEYCYTGNQPLEEKGLQKLLGYISDYNNHAHFVSYKEMMEYALTTSVKVDENVKSIDSIAVVPVSMALPYIRKHLYVIGLSASYFPPKANENYLLLDSDYQIFMGNEYIKSSEDLKLKKEGFFKLLELANKTNCHVLLSYSDYDLAQLKANNPSSVLFEVYQQIFGKEKTVKDFEEYLDKNCKTGYFQYGITNGERYGKHYIEGKLINPQKINIDECEYENKLSEKAYSPTAIIEYFNCPRHFYWTRVLGINEKDEDDAFNVIPANDKGTLFHKQMEDAANGRDKQTNKIVINEDDFLRKAEQEFDEYLKYRAPLQQQDADRVKRDFLQMCKNEYRHDVNNIIVSAESESKKIRVEEADMTVRGIADRVECDKNGDLIIGDYKTGTTIHHDPNDWESCIQVLIYSYITEKLFKDKNVQDCQFRYVALDKTVEINYPNYKSQLIEKLKEFKNGLDNLNFPYADDVDNCKYCRLKEICAKCSAKEDNENE